MTHAASSTRSTPKHKFVAVNSVDPTELLAVQEALEISFPSTTFTVTGPRVDPTQNDRDYAKPDGLHAIAALALQDLIALQRQEWDHTPDLYVSIVAGRITRKPWNDDFLYENDPVTEAHGILGICVATSKGPPRSLFPSLESVSQDSETQSPGPISQDKPSSPLSDSISSAFREHSDLLYQLIFYPKQPLEPSPPSPLTY